MDIMLAGQIDGVETAARIKDSLNIPLISLSAPGDTAALQRAKSLEPCGYILKPFDERNLHAVQVFHSLSSRFAKNNPIPS
jgi:two-component system, response regulator PdtaR